MHKLQRFRPIIALVVILSLAAVAYWQWSANQPRALAGSIVASGSIEAEQTTMAAELAGRLRDLLADEGAAVKQGDVLARLDDSLLAAQIAQSQAAVATAQANLDQVKAGARPEEIAAARATLAQAIAGREGAKRAGENAKRARENPQELNARLDGARTQLSITKSQVIQAQAAAESARVQRDHYPDQDVYAKQVVAAEEGVRVAEANVLKAQAGVDSLLEMLANPLAAQAQVDAADAAYQVAAAIAEAAQARLDALIAGPTPEQVAVAQAAVKQAEAALNILLVQRDKMTVRSPLDGLVTGRALRPGELAAPGAPILTIADLSKVRLTVYIAEDQIGRVRLGQKVQVTVDSFPGRTFPGEVSYISPRAEFTPKNVQTQKERVNTVFGVRIRLSNAEMLLKPGMPADATFAP